MKHKVAEHELLDSILIVFRRYGYEGASMERIAESTGLKKASLYYRFPAGKVEMADAVLSHVDSWFDENVFRFLRANGSPIERLRSSLDQVAVFYDNGLKSCVLESLSFGQVEDRIEIHLRHTLEAWLAALRYVAIDAGHSKSDAASFAEHAIALIEGAIIVQRLLPSSMIFRQNILRILHEFERAKSHERNTCIDPCNKS